MPFLQCGILAHGFLRLRCADCAHEKLVAFSCKRRGFCPACGARRMVETAAHLVARLKSTEAATGAVTLIQRFGSAANLNIHLYCLVSDGVYRTADGVPSMPPPPENCRHYSTGS